MELIEDPKVIKEYKRKYIASIDNMLAELKQLPKEDWVLFAIEHWSEASTRIQSELKENNDGT